MFFVLVVALLAATGAFYWAANNINHGVYWADRMCHDAQMFCDHPWWLLAGAIGVVCLALVRQMLKE